MPVDLTTNTSRCSFSRRSFLKTIGTAALAAPFVTRDLIAKPPSGVLQHASFGASGMAWEDIRQLAHSRRLRLVAVAEVDLNRTEELRKLFPTHIDLPGLAGVAGTAWEAYRLGERLDA